MAYNYSKLLERITVVCGMQATFAKEMGLSEKTVSLKMNNKRGWKQKEMKRACDVLGFSVSEIPEYFFKE